jgi:hypothetical protein
MFDPVCQLLVVCSVYSSTMNMAAVRSSKTLVNCYRSGRFERVLTMMYDNRD